VQLPGRCVEPIVVGHGNEFQEQSLSNGLMKSHAHVFRGSVMYAGSQVSQEAF
jgi:hypothetical protein